MFRRSALRFAQLQAYVFSDDLVFWKDIFLNVLDWSQNIYLECLSRGWESPMGISRWVFRWLIRFHSYHKVYSLRLLAVEMILTIASSQCEWQASVPVFNWSLARVSWKQIEKKYQKPSVPFFLSFFDVTSHQDLMLLVLNRWTSGWIAVIFSRWSSAWQLAEVTS